MNRSENQHGVAEGTPRKPVQGDRPARRQVALRVKEMIRARGLRAGDALPSYVELGKELTFSYVTVKRGIDDLVAEGVIRRQHGRGTFVAKELALIPRELEHVGVIYPSSRESLYRSPYLIEIMRGIAQKSPPQADTHLFSLRQDGLVSAAQLGEWNVNGVILLDMDNDDYLRAFAQWGTPGVVVDYCSQAAPLDYVACDNRAAARQMVAHLAALGHRRVVYVSAPSQREVKHPDNVQATLLIRDSSDARERRAEGVAALNDREMLADVLDLAAIRKDDRWGSGAPGHPGCRIGASGGPTAVLADGNYTAIEVLTELARRGLRVPEDVSVCAVASDSDTVFGGRRLTCGRFDFLGMGQRAIEILAARCRNPGMVKPRVHRIGFEFVEGQTTGPARKARSGRFKAGTTSVRRREKA